jgi:2-keto-4-pentenoate hydratase/2-oxohepta-3-ene-1,7-dioic acid hydratase in catechol pathway
MTLMPGDVIITGTPAGASELNIGDVLEGNIEGLGTIKNTVVGG